MNKWKSILAAASLAAVLAVGVACSSNGEAANTPASQPAPILAPASSQPSEPAVASTGAAGWEAGVVAASPLLLHATPTANTAAKLAAAKILFHLFMPFSRAQVNNKKRTMVIALTEYFEDFDKLV